MLKIGMYVDASNLYRKGAQPVNYKVLRKFVQYQGHLLRCNIYVTVDPENPKPVKGFISALRSIGYKVIEKEWVRGADGRVKADMDMELAIDMLQQAPALDILILVSGDGDFVHLVRAVQGFGKRVEAIAFRDRVSFDLIREVDKYIELESIEIKEGDDYEDIFMPSSEGEEFEIPEGVDNDPKNIGN